MWKEIKNLSSNIILRIQANKYRGIIAIVLK